MVKRIGIGIMALAIGIVLWPFAIRLWGFLLEAIVWPSAVFWGDSTSPFAGEVSWPLLCILLGVISGFAISLPLRISPRLLNGILVSVGVAFYPIFMWLFGVISAEGIPHWWFQEVPFILISPPIGAALCVKMLANKSLEPTQ